MLGCTCAEYAPLGGFLDTDVPSGTRRADLIIPGSQVRVLPRPLVELPAIVGLSTRYRSHPRLRDAEIDRPKSRGSIRDVPISGDTARQLAAHRLASKFSGESDFVFATRSGAPQAARNAYRWFKPAARVAGARWAGFHTLRHTAASRWLHGGVGIAQVSRLLGHADAAFTLRVYISVLPDDLPDGEALAAAVWTAPRRA